MKAIRIDKFLSEMGIGTRSQVKDYLKNGTVEVNGETIRKPDFKIKPDTDRVCYQKKEVFYAAVEYYLLNKPAGYVSAVTDNRFPTVVELLKDKKRNDLFPVGRLDKDTEGLLIITNDGKLTHELLAPGKHVPKKYFVVLDQLLSEEEKSLVEHGIDIGGGEYSSPANLIILTDQKPYEAELTIYEGKFHQVKRMFQAVGKEVLYLRRIAMGGLTLPDDLPTGSYRELTKEDLERLKQKNETNTERDKCSFI